MNRADRHERLERSCLYVVTDARQDRGDLPEFLDAILGAGVDIVQLREKEAEARDLIRWGATFAAAAERHGALFTVNDRPSVALALAADGVHLGQNDLPVDVARTVLGEDALIGVSTRTAEQWEGADPGADYVCAGPVWETPTKPGRPAARLAHVRYVAERERRPWFAIGGIDPSTIEEVVEAGARRVVVVRAVTEADDPVAAVKALLSALL